jgi:hypothetical protein
MVDIKHGQSSKAPVSTERSGSFKSQADLNGKYILLSYSVYGRRKYYSGCTLDFKMSGIIALI